MSNLVKRLRDADTTRRIGESYADTHERRQRDREEAADRIEQLEAENASLASWQCEFTDGKTGLVYGQGGTTFCIMAKRMQQLEAEAKTRTLDYLGQVGQLSEEIERLRAALRRIDKMEVYEADAAVVLWAKIGIMRDIARAALEDRT